MVLLGVFQSLYDIIKIKESGKPITDTKVFQLHYKWTRLLLFIFCIIVSLNSLIGECRRYCVSVRRALFYSWVSFCIGLVGPEPYQ